MAQDILSGQNWFVHHGDCIEHMPTLPDACVDGGTWSPPFPSLYSYSCSQADIGNSESLRHDAKIHLSFFYRQFARLLKPGRAIIVHVMQIPRMKRAGEVGMHDFRGLNIRLAERAGLIYEYDWLVPKNAQSQAIRTRARELQFSGLESDRARCRGSMGDYLLKFRAPGVNAVPVDSPDCVTRNMWIEWASSVWDDIVETDTLNTAEAKGNGDTRHVCPLQLEVVRRCVLMFTNPGEIVFSPFAGIGSEGYMALGGASPKTGKRINNPRRFYGIELKDEYHAAAMRNCAKAEKQVSQLKQSSLPLE